MLSFNLIRVGSKKYDFKLSSQIRTRHMSAMQKLIDKALIYFVYFIQNTILYHWILHGKTDC